MAQNTSEDLIMDEYRPGAVKTTYKTSFKPSFEIDVNSSEWKRLCSHGKSYTAFTFKMGSIVFDYILEKNCMKKYQMRLQVNKHIIGQTWTVSAWIFLCISDTSERGPEGTILFSDKNNSAVWPIGDLGACRQHAKSRITLLEWSTVEPARCFAFREQNRMTDVTLYLDCGYLNTSKAILAVHSEKFRDLFYSDTADLTARRFPIDFVSYGDAKLFLQAIHPPFASSGDYLELLWEWNSRQFETSRDAPSVIERVLTLSETLGSSTLRSIAEQTLKNAEQCEKLRVPLAERLSLSSKYGLTITCSEILKSLKPKNILEIIDSEAYDVLSDSVKEYLLRLNPVKKQAPKRRQSTSSSVPPRKSLRLQNKDPIAVTAPRTSRR